MVLGFGIYTNGLLMSPNIQNAIIDNANKTSTEKPSFVAFDITASLVSDKFYRELVPIIEHLVNMKNNSKCRLQVNTPILAINGKSDHITLYPVVRTLKNIGVDTIRLSFPWSLHESGEVEEYGFLKKEEYHRAVKIFKELESDFSEVVSIREPQQKPFNHCFVMRQTIAVSPEGDVFPCPEVCVPVFKNDLSYGNVTKKNISALWDSRSHQEKFLAFNPRNHKCSCCPVDWDFNKLCAQYWPPTLG